MILAGFVSVCFGRREFPASWLSFAFSLVSTCEVKGKAWLNRAILGCTTFCTSGFGKVEPCASQKPRITRQGVPFCQSRLRSPNSFRLRAFQGRCRSQNFNTWRVRKRLSTPLNSSPSLQANMKICDLSPRVQIAAEDCRHCFTYYIPCWPSRI
jgi:hypothetical protein